MRELGGFDDPRFRRAGECDAEATRYKRAGDWQRASIYSRHAAMLEEEISLDTKFAPNNLRVCAVAAVNAIQLFRQAGDAPRARALARHHLDRGTPFDTGERAEVAWIAAVQLHRPREATEAMQWKDTAENRELFAAWFEDHDITFETHGSLVCLPHGDKAIEGDWIVRTDEGFAKYAEGFFERMFEPR